MQSHAAAIPTLQSMGTLVSPSIMLLILSMPPMAALALRGPVCLQYMVCIRDHAHHLAVTTMLPGSVPLSTQESALATAGPVHPFHPAIVGPVHLSQSPQTHAAPRLGWPPVSVPCVTTVSPTHVRTVAAQTQGPPPAPAYH